MLLLPLLTTVVPIGLVLERVPKEDYDKRDDEQEAGHEEEEPVHGGKTEGRDQHRLGERA